MRLFILLVLLALVISCATNEEKLPVNNLTDKVSFNHLEGCMTTSPVLDESNLYLTTANGNIFKIEKNSGKVLWQYKVEGNIITSPVVLSTKVIVLSTYKTLTALDIEKGSKLWEKKWTKDIDPKVDLDDVKGCLVGDKKSNKLLIGDTSGNLWGINSDNGLKAWYVSLNGALLSSPSVDDGVAFITTSHGVFYSIKMDDGSSFWNVPKVIVKNVKGSVDNVPDSNKVDYNINIELKYNVDKPEMLKDNKIVISVLTEASTPIKMVNPSKPKESIEIINETLSNVNSLFNRTISKKITLFEKPQATEQPIIIEVKDGSGNILDRNNFKITFKSNKK